MKFSKPVINTVKYYVYLYSHPNTGEVFYVGKGKGNRVFSHLEDKKESEKMNYLKELSKQGLKPKIEILIHGLENEETALRVEASIIDLLGVKNLTNKQSGWKSASYGRMRIEQVISAYTKQKVEVEGPSMIIRISKAFRYSMNENELYDITRSAWKVGVDRARKAKYAFAVYEGTIQEVYKIEGWYPAGKTLAIRRDKLDTDNRWEFVGNIAEKATRDRYRHKSVEHYFKQGNINPITYIGC